MWTLDAWMLSARLAWGRPALRVASIAALSISIAVGLWFTAQVLPSAKANGTFAYHYNIYVGIDDLREWWWVFVLPGVWVGLTVADLLAAYGLYRTDDILARSLIILALLWSLPWSVALFYLTVINSV
ncbi:hypothetical protein M0Q28_01690 [Patescibacteria group bacterium]|jgi:hypothetical protein|nr:hypothetical protein [Patescibacteria group bacterium]